MGYDLFLREFQKCGSREELDGAKKYWKAKIDAQFADKKHPELRESLAALETAYTEALRPFWQC